MSYLEISIITTATEAERFAEGLDELEALSVTLEDAKDHAVFQIDPGETPLWNQVKVKALFSDDVSPRIIIDNLKKILEHNDPINYRIKKIADQDWVRLTQQHFKPQCYANNLWICPGWYEEKLEGRVVKIDPGLAFGTGTHPTTNLCLEWLAKHLLNQKTVIDYGCGSGILALAALAMGAEHIYAVDHDEQALIATKNNLALNPDFDSQKISTYYPNQVPEIKADVMIANILANPLIELAPTLTQLIKPQGQLILSGLLEAEIPKVSVAYKNDFEINESEIKAGWAALILHKNKKQRRKTT